MPPNQTNLRFGVPALLRWRDNAALRILGTHLIGFLVANSFRATDGTFLQRLGSYFFWLSYHLGRAEFPYVTLLFCKLCTGAQTQVYHAMIMDSSTCSYIFPGLTLPFWTFLDQPRAPRHSPTMVWSTGHSNPSRFRRRGRLCRCPAKRSLRAPCRVLLAGCALVALPQGGAMVT